MSGLAWTGTAKWTVQALSWLSTLVVARLLTPTDYGIVGMATIYLGLVGLVSEFGLGSAIVQGHTVDASQIGRLGGFSIAAGVALFGLSCALAGPIAAFFGEAAVRLVLMVLAANFIISAFQVVPNALLVRDLRFRTLAMVDAGAALGQTAVTLGLAIAGTGYWALIFGSLLGSLLRSALLVGTRPHRLAWPWDLSSMRGALTFGWHIVVARVAWYVYSNADFAVAGRVLGKAALGAYTFGWNLASVPVDKITAVLTRVTMPVFAAVQDDAEEVKRYLLAITEGLLLVVLPASIGLALVAPDFVRFAVGDRWRAAIVPLQLLACHVSFRCLGAVYAQALVAMGNTRQNMRLGLAQVLAMPPLFYSGAVLGGINGVAWAWLIGHPVVTAPIILHFIRARVDFRMAALARASWPAVSGTLAMTVAVVAVHAALPGTRPGLRLGVAVVSGALAYCALLWLVHRGRVTAFAAVVRQLRRR